MSQEPPLFIFRGAELLVRLEAGLATPMPAGEPGELLCYAFGDCQVAEWPAEAPAPEGLMFKGLRPLHAQLAPEAFSLAGRAFQLLTWARTHRYCGACGTETRPHAHEVARECPRCGLVTYPRLNPAVIMLVTRGPEALLSRSPHFAPGMFSTIAGFVGPGESLEDAVRREVREEVGVEITDIRYFGSQPWPFPNSLMIGFTARYAGGEVVVDHGELEDARWFSVDALPVVPARLSIARALIDDFVRRHGGDPDALESPVYR